MSKYRQKTSAYHFFSSQAISTGLLSWVDFKRLIANKPMSETINARLKCEDISRMDDRQVVQQCLTPTGHHPTQHVNGAWLATVIGVIFGTVAMTGALSYSGESPVNLWIILGFFCFIPALLTIFTLVSWLSKKQPSHPVIPILGRFAFKKLYRQYVEIEDTISLQLLNTWALWKLQWMALTYQLSALVTFCAVIIFNDIAFGWSSTIITGDEWMTRLLHAVAWPWHWLLDPPSHELISNSRFFREGMSHTLNNYSAIKSGEWWSYVVMAMVVYGFLPRLILTLWMRYALKRILIRDIRSSGDIERVINLARQVKPQALQKNQINTNSQFQSDEYLPLSDDLSDLSGCTRLAWQCTPKNVSVDFILGEKDWQTDETWISKTAPSWEHKVAIFVTLQQTPTAELEDLITIIKDCNAKLLITMCILNDQTVNTAPQRAHGLYKSWTYFSKQNQVSISLLTAPQRTATSSSNEK